MADHTNRSSFSSMVHHTITFLTASELSREQQRHVYTARLCRLAAETTDWSYASQWTLVDNLSPNAATVNADFQGLNRHILAAAAYLGRNYIVLQLLEKETIDLHYLTYIGRFFECAAKDGNDEVLSRFCSSSNADVC